VKADTRARRYADTYSSADVVRLAGISYRQVDHWVRLGLLRTASPCHGSGTIRRFHPVEINVARILAALRALGIGDSTPTSRLGGELLHAVAAAVRAGDTGAHVGAWYVAIDDMRVTLWTAYRTPR
jgi:hypothetical protein